MSGVHEKNNVWCSSNLKVKVQAFAHRDTLTLIYIFISKNIYM